MRSSIQKWGNSQAIRLPKTLLEIAQINENDSVEINAEHNVITIKKATTTQHRSLKDRLEGFTGTYSFDEWDTGQPVGSEVL